MCLTPPWLKKYTGAFVMLRAGLDEIAEVEMLLLLRVLEENKLVMLKLLKLLASRVNGDGITRGRS